MNVKAAALQERIRRFRADLEPISGAIVHAGSSRRLLRQLTAAATAVDTSYAAACAATAADPFIVHITAAARHAKRARVRLQDLMHLDYVIEGLARHTMLEARDLEAILTASRNTAKRRRRIRDSGFGIRDEGFRISDQG